MYLQICYSVMGSDRVGCDMALYRDLAALCTQQDDRNPIDKALSECEFRGLHTTQIL